MDQLSSMPMATTPSITTPQYAPLELDISNINSSGEYSSVDLTIPDDDGALESNINDNSTTITNAATKIENKDHYLIATLFIFAAQGSVFVKLNTYNSTIFSACNILCAASFYTLVFLIFYLIFYKKSISYKDVQEVSAFNWCIAVFGSFLYSVIGPLFSLMALQSISIPQAAIIQRLESVNFLLLSYLFLGADISCWTLLSVCLTLIGVVVSVLWNWHNHVSSKQCLKGRV
jgi:uncharacterized membrane protein